MGVSRNTVWDNLFDRAVDVVTSIVFSIGQSSHRPYCDDPPPAGPHIQGRVVRSQKSWKGVCPNRIAGFSLLLGRVLQPAGALRLVR